MEQSVPKRRHIKFRRRGVTQNKATNIQKKAKVWNQENYNSVCVTCSLLAFTLVPSPTAVPFLYHIQVFCGLVWQRAVIDNIWRQFYVLCGAGRRSNNYIEYWTQLRSPHTTLSLGICFQFHSVLVCMFWYTNLYFMGKLITLHQKVSILWHRGGSCVVQ